MRNPNSVHKKGYRLLAGPEQRALIPEIIAVLSDLKRPAPSTVIAQRLDRIAGEISSVALQCTNTFTAERHYLFGTVIGLRPSLAAHVPGWQEDSGLPPSRRKGVTIPETVGATA